MSEWTSVFAVFWGLWAIDGARLGRSRVLTLVGWRRLHAWDSRLSCPGLLPTSGRAISADIPLALSPAGLCNRAVGAVARPTETPATVRAWRWDEVRQVGVAKGWIFINGERFCPDTGHVSARELLRLAALAPAEREARLGVVLARWFRPAHLRRRWRSLARRSRWPALLNAIVLVSLLALTVYVVGDFSARLPERWSAGIALALPGAALALFALHVAAVALAWRAMRRLRPVTAEKRGASLFSALLLPPQALRLRALLGEGFFPAQHPLAVAVALGRRPLAEEWAFHALADIRYPIGVERDDALARAVTAWFGGALAPRLEAATAALGRTPAELFAAPSRDAPESCRYCPRCRDQFQAGREICPQGVPLLPLGHPSTPQPPPGARRV